MDTARQVTGIREHCDWITEGWRFILGGDLHSGVFCELADDRESRATR